ncbi:MAG: MarR family transcriptional regulator [Actinobacteria bacterium]|nr:MarR family transcriptional regulator [Actinomycetota bacterium]MCL5446322.1 MarR family transcriptional regulator [Actinomycetota bacterium]
MPDESMAKSSYQAYHTWDAHANVSSGDYLTPSVLEKGVAERADMVKAMLVASRSLVAITARSLASTGYDVTLPQYRTLVLLYHRGPLSSAEVAEELNVNPSTATRMMDRLCAKRLVAKHSVGNDRRKLRLTLTKLGAALVGQVLEARGIELSKVLDRVPEDTWPALYEALSALSRASGDESDVYVGLFT